MKVLIVDDEEMIRSVLREYAEFEGYEVDEAVDGMEAVIKCRNGDYDIILMDIMMPRLDGYSAVTEIRKIKNIPIIMLSARSEEYDKLLAFHLEVDDYVTKPFSPKEVIARINAIIRRRNASEKHSEQTIYQFEGLRIDMAGRNVFVDGEKIMLTPKEYELLFYMVMNNGIALSRETLIQKVWDYSYIGDDRTVDTHVKTLRSNLKQYRKFILTERSVGYKFYAKEDKPNNE